MDLDRARTVVAEQPRAVLATLRRDGSPQMSPVMVAVDGDALVVSSRQTAFKVRNLRRNPHAWLCILPEGFFGNWIQVSGSVDIVDLPDAMDGLIRYYRTLSGEHEDWDDYRRAMVQEKRCLIRITPTHAGPDRSG